MTDPGALAQAGMPAILLVEDEILIRYDAAEILREAGMGVLEAGNGQEALSVLNSGVGIDLLVTDINMPGAPDGLALAALARELRPGLPVLLATARPPGDPGGVHVLAKPYGAAELLGMVSRILEAAGGGTVAQDN